MAKRKSDPIRCPHCGSLDYRSLKKGSVTRCCGEQVVRVNRKWYGSKEESPEWQAITRFIEKKQRTLPYYDIPFGNSHYREIVKAASQLVKNCGGDVELALSVVDVAFDNPPHSSRSKPTFYSVISKWHFPDMLAMAKGAQARVRKEREANSVFASGAIALSQ